MCIRDRATTDPPFDAFGVYRRNCGNLLGELHRRGLVDDEARWTFERAPVVAAIMQRYIFASLNTRTPPANQLTAPERELFLRWRIETPGAFSLKERLRYVDEIDSYLPDYPAEAALFLVLASEDLPRAKSILRNRISSSSAHRARHVAWLEQLEKKGSSAPPRKTEDHSGH